MPIDEEQTLAKVARRLIPFMIFLYLLNYLDRVNVSCAKLQMTEQFNLTEFEVSCAFSAFYIGYCLFEVPSNLIMARVGAKLWISRIMISWGLVSVCMIFIRGAWSFYAMRLLLGVAEAGFFPGMILYLTYWIPRRKRAQASAWFLTSTAVSGVIGNPLAGYLMTLGAKPGAASVAPAGFFQSFYGWQLLFLVEGTATVLVGFAAYLYLTDKPEHAQWLSMDERTWLSDHLRSEQPANVNHNHSLAPAFRDSKVWVLCFVYSMMLFGFYGVIYWTPTIIEKVSGNQDKAVTGALSAIPFLAASVGMVLIARSSDRSGERPRHVAYSCLAGAIGMVATCCATSSTVLTIAGLSLAAAGAFGTLGPFWAMPSTFLHGAAAAAGIAVINSVGNFAGGFIGPLVMGFMKDYTKSYVSGLMFYAAALLAGSVVSVMLINRSQPTPTIELQVSNAE